MPGTLTVNLSDPELADAFTDAQPGDIITLSEVTLTVGVKNEQSLEGEIDNLTYEGVSYGYGDDDDEGEAAEIEPEVPPQKSGRMGMMTPPPMPAGKGGKGVPTTVIAIGAGRPGRGSR